MMPLVKKHGRQYKVIENLVNMADMSAMLHQIFNDFITRNSFNRNISFSQKNIFFKLFKVRWDKLT